MSRPRLDIPFRFTTTRAQATPTAATVEQDTLDDIRNGVEIVLRYPRGYRSDVPDFGILDMTFEQAPVRLEDVDFSIQRWEPRARAQLDQRIDEFDDLVTRVLVDVAAGRPGG